MDQALQINAMSWLYLPTAIALGSLHGLEPGHSKTMMASFIIAIRGTIKQAILLGLAATVSHTAIIWALAACVLWFKGNLTAESVEPYLEIVSAMIVFALAGWTAWRTWKSTRHPHSHNHYEHDDTISSQTSLALGEYIDNHERQHAEQIQRQFSGGQVTNSQILLFGLTGGLMPCPAAFTVLLLCLQSGRSLLGFSIVLAFSVGLALTLVGIGTVAAISTRYATRKISSLGKLTANLPFLSSAVLIILGIYMFIKGIHGLH
jgi:nickel/cobalt exporter